MFLSSTNYGVSLQASLPFTPYGENQETHVGLTSLLGNFTPSAQHNCFVLTRANAATAQKEGGE